MPVIYQWGISSFLQHTMNVEWWELYLSSIDPGPPMGSALWSTVNPQYDFLKKLLVGCLGFLIAWIKN